VLKFGVFPFLEPPEAVEEGDAILEQRFDDAELVTEGELSRVPWGEDGAGVIRGRDVGSVGLKQEHQDIGGNAWTEFTK
jgi:hypothetical protein